MIFKVLELVSVSSRTTRLTNLFQLHRFVKILAVEAKFRHENQHFEKSNTLFDCSALKFHLQSDFIDAAMMKPNVLVCVSDQSAARFPPSKPIGSVMRVMSCRPIAGLEADAGR